MVKTISSVLEATREWVNQFNAIPQSVVDKLIELNAYSVREITPPAKGDRVRLYGGEHDGEAGEILCASEDDEDVYIIELDGSGEMAEVSQDAFKVSRDDMLPMWGTMWTFGDSCDNWWIEEREGLQKMADCGFRIYENDDLEYIFGIDGAGYDFYEAHWIPLYRARGLRWHDTAIENDEHDK